MRDRSKYLNTKHNTLCKKRKNFIGFAWSLYLVDESVVALGYRCIMAYIDITPQMIFPKVTFQYIFIASIASHSIQLDTDWSRKDPLDSAKF